MGVKKVKIRTSSAGRGAHFNNNETSVFYARIGSSMDSDYWPFFGTLFYNHKFFFDSVPFLVLFSILVNLPFMGHSKYI